MTEPPPEPYAGPYDPQPPGPAQPGYQQPYPDAGGPYAPGPYGPGPYGPGPYGPGPYGPGPYGPRPRTNGLAVASLVLGILWLYWLGSVVALVLGYVALGQIRNAPPHEPQEGRGMAIAGIVLGWVGVGALLLVILFGVVVGVGAAYA